MKVRDLIDIQIKDLMVGGLTPKFITLMPRALDVLILEVSGETGQHAMDRTSADGTIVYRGLEVVVVPYLSRLTPICVVGSVAEELDVYHLKVKKERDATVQPT